MIWHRRLLPVLIINKFLDSCKLKFGSNGWKSLGSIFLMARKPPTCEEMAQDVEANCVIPIDKFRQYIYYRMQLQDRAGVARYNKRINSEFVFMIFRPRSRQRCTSCTFPYLLDTTERGRPSESRPDTHDTTLSSLLKNSQISCEVANRGLTCTMHLEDVP